MFESVETAPPDAILGLTEAFNQDTNPDKINLSVGVYKDADGTTPTLPSVKEAERRLLETEPHKAYRPITGDPAYGKAVLALMLGADHEAVTSGRAVAAHTPGGTGALRVAGDYLTKVHPEATLWLSDPTWANHPQVFAAAGVPAKSFPYFDKASNGLAIDAMVAALEKVPAGDVVLLHGCCHNPTGVDPSPEQWRRIADVLYDRGVLPLLDFAYQGFGQGLDEDRAGLLELVRPGQEMLVCSSFSKNFGLYSERVGALTVLGGTPDAAQAVLSHVKSRIRANYSNPPAHGGGIVTTILGDEELRALWQVELKQMRDRINGMRALFEKTLDAKGVRLGANGNGFITRQNGMFSFSGLTRPQVEALREKHSIYIVGSGRINVAGMTESNMDRLCDAIAEVVGAS